MCINLIIDVSTTVEATYKTIDCNKYEIPFTERVNLRAFKCLNVQKGFWNSYKTLRNALHLRGCNIVVLILQSSLSISCACQFFPGFVIIRNDKEHQIFAIPSLQQSNSMSIQSISWQITDGLTIEHGIKAKHWPPRPWNWT